MTSLAGNILYGAANMTCIVINILATNISYALPLKSDNKIFALRLFPKHIYPNIANIIYTKHDP